VATALAAELELLAARQRSRIQRIALATRLAIARQWRRLDTSALTASWDGGIGRQATLALSAGQYAAAQGATPFVTAAMALQDLDPDASEGAFVAETLAGMASDGRPLSSLLYESLIDVKERLGRGAALDDAMRIGLGSLERMVDTQVADAARVGISVASTARKDIQWFVRTLTPPSCARCAILAGKITSVERPFPRHPRCDCINLPIGDRKLANEMVRSPMDYFKSLGEADQNATFTKAGAQAIRDGADIFQVVNARRGMSTAGSFVTGSGETAVTHRGRTISGRFTSEGMTRRGLAAQGLRKTPGARRLTPEAIMALASDRDEAIRLLRRFGYLT
jgi:hypothetical protein